VGPDGVLAAACVAVAPVGFVAVCVAFSSPPPPQAAKATKSSERTTVVRSPSVRDIYYLLQDSLVPRPGQH